MAPVARRRRRLGLHASPAVAFRRCRVILGSARAVAQLGSALDWGSSGRRFKSCQPDQSSCRSRRFRRTLGPPYFFTPQRPGSATGYGNRYERPPPRCGLRREADCLPIQSAAGWRTHGSFVSRGQPVHSAIEAGNDVGDCELTCAAARARSIVSGFVEVKDGRCRRRVHHLHDGHGDVRSS